MKGELVMTVRERILTIKLLEKIKNDPGYAEKLGLSISNNRRE